MVGFDFQAMRALQKDTQQQGQARHQKAEKALETAKKFLKRFQSDPSPEVVEAIRKNLLESIRYKSNQAVPFVILSYLYYCYADLNASIRYYKEAESIDANAPEVRRMKQMIDQMLEKPPEQVQREVKTHFKVPQSDSEYERLHDETQNMIIQNVREMMSAPPPTPSTDLQAFEAFQDHMQDLEALFATLEERFEVLDDYMDTGQLRMQARPLEVTRRRFQGIQRGFQHFERAEKLLQHQQKRVDAAREDLKSGAQTADQILLEQILDDCDRAADILDEIEAENLDLSSLLPRYEALVADVEKLQDEIDEKLEG